MTSTLSADAYTRERALPELKKLDIENNKQAQRNVLQRVQDLENAGYQFEAANASFELLLYGELGKRRPFWNLDHYRCVILKTNGGAATTEAIVKLKDALKRGESRRIKRRTSRRRSQTKHAEDEQEGEDEQEALRF